jgi:hypothetical protein
MVVYDDDGAVDEVGRTRRFSSTWLVVGGGLTYLAGVAIVLRSSVPQHDEL